MGNLDPFNAFAGATEPTFPNRESESWRRACAASHEHSGRILQNAVPASGVGLFHSGFRAWVFLLLVCQDVRAADRGLLDAATNRVAQPLPHGFGCDLGPSFQLR